MTDYERGVEQASATYKEVIRGYVSENDKLRELVRDLWTSCPVKYENCAACKYKDSETAFGCALYDRMEELGIEVDDGTE